MMITFSLGVNGDTQAIKVFPDPESQTGPCLHCGTIVMTTGKAVSIRVLLGNSCPLQRVPKESLLMGLFILGRAEVREAHETVQHPKANNSGEPCRLRGRGRGQCCQSPERLGLSGWAAP